MIGYLLERLNASIEISGIVVCIPEADKGSALDAACRRADAAVCYGPENDVASRYGKTLAENPCEAFVRICADSPVMDSALIDTVVRHYHARPKGKTIASNVGCGYPSGQQVEVVDAAFYRRVEPAIIDREHVTADFYWLYREQVFLLPALRDRWQKMSVDTASDFERIAALVELMPDQHWQYGWYRCHQELERLSRQRA